MCYRLFVAFNVSTVFFNGCRWNCARLDEADQDFVFGFAERVAYVDDLLDIGDLPERRFAIEFFCLLQQDSRVLDGMARFGERVVSSRYPVR